MNSAPPEMLQHCLSSPGNSTGVCTDMTVLERQRARFRWQQDHEQTDPQTQPHHHHHNNANAFFNPGEQTGMFYDPAGFRALIAGDSAAINRAVKPDPGLEMGYASPAVHVAGGAISRTSSCPASGDGFSPAEKNSLAVGREGFKKRKANDKAQPITKVILSLLTIYIG